MKHLVTLAAFLALALGTVSAPAQEAGHVHHPHDHAEAAATTTAAAPEVRVGDPWPLDTCVVASRSKLGSMGDPIIKIHNGREVRFCCAGCTGAFENDPGAFLARADAAIIEQQLSLYPLDHCIVDKDEKIDPTSAEAIKRVVGNRLFVVCCPGCVRALEADPAKYIAQLDEAVIKAQSEDYPLDTCAVSGLSLDAMGGAVNHVVAGQLVKLCCAPCARTIERDPAAILAKLAEARAAASKEQ